jgi:hypothetical protein
MSEEDRHKFDKYKQITAEDLGRGATDAWPIEYPMETLKAIMLVAGNPDFASVRRRIMNIARDEGLAYLIPSNWNPDGTLKP